MKTRIGIVTPQPAGRSKTSFVEAADAKDLVSELNRLGAKQVALFWRDRIGDGHTEGAPFAIKDLTEQHFAWVATPTKDGMRAVVCV
ncbi:MAG: hypothetical protein RLZZ15_3080 [Verrucomicrobiota bacterium]|jgi:hypothetical protein